MLCDLHTHTIISGHAYSTLKENIEEGKKSVAFSLVFRAADRTLEESEVTEICEKVVAEIESEIKAKLRS